MNTLLWMCKHFLFFLYVVTSFLKINGCKITTTNKFQFECISEKMTFDSSVNSIMIYFWIENTDDEGDYILLCERIPPQAVFNCTQPKPPFKWSNSQEFCLLRSGDPNSCLKVTTDNAMTVFGHYSCKSIPEHTEAEKCLYSKYSKDTTVLPAAKQQASMTLTYTTTITPTEQANNDSDSHMENTLNPKATIAIIAAACILFALVPATITACVVSKRTNICRSCVFNQDFRNIKRKQEISDVENPSDQKEENVPENAALLQGTTSDFKTTYLAARENLSSKETSVKEGTFDPGHVLDNTSSEKTQSFNHATLNVVNRGCKSERLSKSHSQEQLTPEGEEAETLIKEITNENFNDAHDAPDKKDEKAADETSGFSVKDEGKNASSTKTYVTNPKQTDLKDSVQTYLPTLNHLTETILTGHNRDVHLNCALTQHPNRSMETVGENIEILHSGINETVSSATTAQYNDQLIKEKSDEHDLVTDCEEIATSTPTFMRQSSVSAVQDSEPDGVSDKDKFTLPDPLLMAKAEDFLSRKYYGDKRSKVEELLKENNDVMDQLAIYASFVESGKVKCKAFEDWVQVMDTLARRREDQLHDKMKEIRKAKKEETVNHLFLERAHFILNQLTIKSVTKEPSNSTSTVDFVEQFNVGLREKSSTENMETQKQDTDSHNYSENPAIERTCVTHRGKDERQPPDYELNTISSIEDVLNKKIIMSVSVPRDSNDSTCMGTQNPCNGANFHNDSAYSVRGATTADRRMPKTGGRAEFQEDHANAPMENSRLIPRLNTGIDQFLLNGNKPAGNDEDDDLLPLGVSTPFMDVYRGGLVETQSALSIRISCNSL